MFVVNNARMKKKRQILRHLAFRSRRCEFVVVVGGGINPKKGKRCQASLIGFSGLKRHPQCSSKVLIQ